MMWDIAEVGSLCDLRNGKAYRSDDWAEAGYPIIRIQNLNDRSKGFNYWAGSLDKQVHVQAGDILLAWSGTPGTSFGAHIWNGPEGVLNQHIFRVDLTSESVDPKWFLFCVNRQLNVLIDAAHGGVGLKHVTKGAVQSLQIPLPPLPEQKRIAAILDAADALRAKRRESIAQLDALLQSTFLEMFGDPVENPKGWDRASIEELTSAIEGGWSPKCEDYPAAEGEWGVLKLGAVTKCRYDGEQNKATKPDTQVREQLEVRAGDLLFSRKNTYELVAACAYVWDTRPRLMMSDLIFRFVFQKGAQIEPVFLWQQLVNARLRQNIQGLAGGAAGSMPNISKAKLREVSVVLPPIGLQKEYVRRVSAVHELVARCTGHLESLDDLFGSLQSRAFSGEL